MRQTVGMSRLLFRESRVLSAALMATIGFALAACSSNGGGNGSTSPATTPASTPASSASSEPTSGTAAIAAIKTNWAAFFSNKTPVPQRIALLENGSQFASIIRGQAGHGLAAGASSKAVLVSLTNGANQAQVTYEILLGGKVALSGQHGVAVYQNGVWKVGAVSFCGLLRLEGLATLPPSCTA